MTITRRFAVILAGATLAFLQWPDFSWAQSGARSLADRLQEFERSESSDDYEYQTVGYDDLNTTTPPIEAGDAVVSSSILGNESSSESGLIVPTPAAPSADSMSSAFAQDIEQQLREMKGEWSKFKADMTKTKYPNVAINGFFQADIGYFDQSPNNMATVGDIQDGAGFRRLRLSTKGAVVENVNYFVQLDFGFFGRPTFTDVWMEITHLPVLGNVRVGQWKHPFGLEVVTTVRYQTFLERSVLFQAFAPFRHIGVGTYNNSDDEMTTWAASLFKTGNDQFGNDIGDGAGVSVAGRVTHLPWYEECDDGSLRYLHLGGAYWHGNPGNNTFRYSTIPELYIGAFGTNGGPGTSLVGVPNVANGTPPFVDTGAFAVNNFNHFGGELLWVRGPLSIQSEATLAIVNPVGLAQMHYKGAYAAVSYFLTGESRPYDRKTGTLDRVKPLHNFHSADGCGWGAWELASRFSYIDLNDGDINGGRMNDWTAGMNWYLNPYTKFQFNYVKSFLADPTQGHSYANMFALRAQIDF